MIPERLGKYEIRRELGQGAMGVVYEGYDPMIQRVVALKTIRADQLQGDAAAEIIARFRREAQAAGRLSHPNVVAIHEFGEDAGTWFIAMEFVAGRSLKGAMSSPERQIIREVLEANKWNRNATAAALGINRTTLYKKMKRLGLEDMATAMGR